MYRELPPGHRRKSTTPPKESAGKALCQPVRLSERQELTSYDKLCFSGYRIICSKVIIMKIFQMVRIMTIPEMLGIYTKKTMIYFINIVAVIQNAGSLGKYFSVDRLSPELMRELV